MNETFMKEKPILPLIASMSLPAVVSMIVNSLYNIIDSFFVAMISEDALTAVSLVFPMQNFVNAVSIGFGVGLNAVISVCLGAKQNDTAHTAATHGMVLSVVHGVVLTAVTFALIPSFLRMFTDDEAVVSMGLTYAYIVFGFSTILTIGLAYEKMFQAVGRMNVTMIALICGCLTNIVGDPILIFGFGPIPAMGIAGAAWATGLCQTLSFAILITCLWKGIGSLRFRPAFIARTPKLYLSIVQTGMPSLTRNSFGAIAASVLNLAAGQFGDVGVAAMSIVGRVIMITNAGMIGLGQGYQPVLGYNWGAKLYRRVRTALVSVLSMATALMTVLGVLGFIFAPEIIGFFETNDPHVLEIGVEALRYQCIIVLGRAAIGTFLASTRQGICFLPMILLLPPLLGIRGVELAQPAAETLAFFICGFFVVHFYREVRSLIADPGAQRTLPLHGSGKSN